MHPAGKRNTLLLPVVVNLAVLGLFKYLDFFLGIFGITVADGGVMLAALRGITNGLNSIGFAFRSPTSALPLGLSFYAFQVISYVADVYRGKVKAERSFFNLLLYLSMFPKMMQGPIVRYEQVARQLMDRRTTPRAAFEGAQRFIIGLAKKVLLADYAGKVVASLSTGGGNGTFVGAWLAALMFMFQIYFDFSGYSDMAIGLGRIFGFRYCENFDLSVHLHIHHGVLAPLAHVARAASSATMSISRSAATASGKARSDPQPCWLSGH